MNSIPGKPQRSGRLLVLLISRSDKNERTKLRRAFSWTTAALVSYCPPNPRTAFDARGKKKKRETTQHNYKTSRGIVIVFFCFSVFFFLCVSFVNSNCRYVFFFPVFVCLSLIPSRRHRLSSPRSCLSFSFFREGSHDQTCFSFFTKAGVVKKKKKQQQEVKLNHPKMRLFYIVIFSRAKKKKERVFTFLPRSYSSATMKNATACFTRTRRMTNGN